MINDLRMLFARELKTWQDELNLYADESLIWQTVPGQPNTTGTLTLHICGNLRHFVGATLGNTSYIRNREVEFSARNISRAELLTQLAMTASEVDSALAALDPRKLEEIYPLVVGKEVRPRTGRFLMHLASHLAYHLGQVDYARRAATGDAASAGTLPMGPLNG